MARLAGRVCYGGLDLASRLDTAAFALCFPPDPRGRASPRPDESGLGETGPRGRASERPDESEKIALLCWHWLPEDTARERQDKVPYLVWRDLGWIRLTDGNVCDYQAILNDIVELSDLFKIQECAFDPWNAEGPTQDLERMTHIRRFEFQQSVAKLNYASKEFEKLIVSGQIEHDGNPVLDWQVGNVNVFTDSSGNIKPKRPEHGDFRTIDGVAATVMALDRALRAPRPPKGSLIVC